jgi:non-heme chloroperoxidase
MQGSALAVLQFTTLALSAQQSAWQDPSKHEIQFVTVENGVRLEVLDWGGSGRALVLLAGSGNTAHVFDDFAGKLTRFSRVYGITRRGFGASSRPTFGYTDQRLADDVLQVLDSLKIVAPVLVGHSMAGNELTTLASQHPGRVSGLVYLDAGADPRDFPASDPTYMELFHKLPAGSRPPFPPAMPEAELRNTFDASVLKAIGEGTRHRDYSRITAPVLSLFAVSGSDTSADPQERAAIEAYNGATMVYIKRYEKTLLTGVPDARIIEIPGANHYLFLSNEMDVLREITAFVARAASERNNKNAHQ